MSSRRLTQQEFMAIAESSFLFYSVLPTDDIQFDGAWPNIDLTCLAQSMLSIDDPQEISEFDLDRLACGLLMNGSALLPSGIDWFALADRMAILYMQQFLPNGSREKKMRAGRANFFLRDILECGLGVPTGIISRCKLHHPFPWDWFPLDDGKLVIDSGRHENIHLYQSNNIIRSWRVGLPTQVDALSVDEFSVTSCFSDGWYLLKGDLPPSFNMHNTPVVTVFDFGRARYFLDTTGCIYTEHNRRMILRLPSRGTWRARFIEDKLYIFSLGIPYLIHSVSMDDLQVSEINTSPVIIPNDICKIGSTFFMVDKMQGKVFSFNKSFKPTGERMSFGRGSYALYDPISLRAHLGSLWALSWMTNTITRVNPF